MVPGCGSAQQQSTIQSQYEWAVEFAEESNGCALRDGYVCEPDSIHDFYSAEAQSQMVSGVLLNAWLIAWEDFRSQPSLSDSQKHLKHYRTGVLQFADAYIVRFQGLLLPEVDDAGEISGALRATLGASVEYRIDRSTLKINSVVWDK